MDNHRKPFVSVHNWGKRGFRVVCYQPAPERDWNAMGHRLAEQFCRTEAAAKRLARSWATSFNAEYQE